jgi:hypothetical protein
VLVAYGLAAWRRQSARPAAAAAAAIAAITIDFVPAPLPTAALERPAIYDTLRHRPEPGALLELPLGLRDGLAHRGSFDDRVLFYQSLHGRPIAGGFVARLPPSVLKAYQDDALLSALLQLSERDRPEAIELPDPGRANVLLRRHGIGFVMLNRATAPAPLTEFTTSRLPLIEIARDAERTLYLVER